MKRPKYVFRAYYGPDAKLPKVEGELAIEVVYTNAWMAEEEAVIAEQRKDIGRVERSWPANATK